MPTITIIFLVIAFLILLHFIWTITTHARKSDVAEMLAVLTFNFCLYAAAYFYYVR